ncbi:MAG: hypothetical protein GX660_13935 [Clostridiaceae bacterium]|nr:hypothetical protein [Clostridiaceae bacterium]
MIDRKKARGEWIPEDFLKFGSNAFSFGGVIFLGAGKKTKYIDAPDKSTFIENFMKTVNHEKGHAIEWEKDPVRYALTIALPSFTHFQFDDVKVNEVLDVASYVSIFSPSFHLSTEIVKQVVGSSPDIANASIFDLMGWSPYYSYYEKPFEYGADSEGGGVLRTGNETVDIHAGEWYQTYSEASIAKTFYYNLNPQQLFNDSIEVNWYSYTREEYQYQQRIKYGHN